MLNNFILFLKASWNRDKVREKERDKVPLGWRHLGFTLYNLIKGIQSCDYDYDLFQSHCAKNHRLMIKQEELVIWITYVLCLCLKGLVNNWNILSLSSIYITQGNHNARLNPCKCILTLGRRWPIWSLLLCLNNKLFI